GADFLDVALSQVQVGTALNDSEQRAAAAPHLCASAQPARGPPERCFHIASLAEGGGALIDRDDDVRPELLLNRDRALGGKQVRGAIEMRLKLGAVFRDDSPAGEAVDLEPSAVGENRSMPGGESMQPAQPSNDFRARAQHQVVGVAQDDLRADSLEVIGCDCLDASRCPYGHECRRLDDASWRMQPSAAGTGAGILVKQLEAHERRL